MDSGSAPVVLHQVPLLPQPEAKAAIIKALPDAPLTPESILLIRKQAKYQAFLTLPTQHAQKVCQLKEVTVGNERVFIRKWFEGFQVFVGGVPESLSAKEVGAFIEAQFGKVVKTEEVAPHEGSKVRLKHLYLQFERDQDAEQCLFSNKKLTINKAELRVARAYAFGENEETDKRLFLKVLGAANQEQEPIEATVNDYFRKEGKLREKIRLEKGRGVIIFTSHEECEKAYKNFRDTKIGKYDVDLRPYIKDSYTIFMGGVDSNLTADQVRECLADYEPIISCQLMRSTHQKSCNAAVTFSSEQSFKRILVEYKGNPKVRGAFYGQPYITIHMSAKDRNEYKSFRKGGYDTKKPVTQPRPMAFPPQNFGGMGMVPFGGMNQAPPMPMPMPGMQNKMGQAPMAPPPMGLPVNTQPRK